MSYSPTLGSVFNRTKMRDPSHVCSFSGMCAMCTADCIGSCEIGLSAVRGMETVYPTTTGENQIASEKVYPVDYSHFNINGRAFGAMGAPLDADRATIYHVGLEQEIGTLNPVKLALPIILPALIKLNWPDYFGGAAMAGVNAAIGEGAVSKAPTLAYENGKVVHAPKLREMLDAFNKYDRGYGQIILQANYDDDAQGVPEYAIRECGAKAIEFKFGQSAKGTQPANLVPTLEEALKKCGQGFLVLPDPRDPGVQEAYGRKACPAFHVYGRLPIWSDDYLIGRIAQLRDMGMTNVYFKMAGFDPEDLEHVLRLASKAQVDMVTFDGAGGGSGYSPCKMMNEWCLPTVVMESILYGILDKLAAEGMELPHVAITGGFATEDQVYKALALGAPYVKAVCMSRSFMIPAFLGCNIEGALHPERRERVHGAWSALPKTVLDIGDTPETIFAGYHALKERLGADEMAHIPYGAIAMWTMCDRLGAGLQHHMAGARKFGVEHIDRTDICAANRETAQETGIPFITEQDDELARRIVLG